MAGQARVHRECSLDDRAELARRLEATRVPLELESQGVLQLRNADPAREARRLVDPARVRGDAVDVGYDTTAEVWGFLSRWVTP